MAKQTINIGSAANDGTGSTLREAFDITNDNFTELYGGTGGLFHKIEGANFTGSLLIGHSTTGTLSSASNNTGIGIGALDALTSGAGNVALGYNTGTVVTEGSNNTLLGYNAGSSLTTGGSNIAIGNSALAAEDTHGTNIAIGSDALKVQDAGANAYNVAIGYNAGKSVSTGIRNTLIGGRAGDALTTGLRNVAIGYSALTNEDTGRKNTAVGHEALKDLNYDGDGNNVAVGNIAGKAITTGIQNTVIGGQAGDALTTGSNNIIIGYEAAASAVDVSNEVTIGDSNISNVRIPSDSTLKIGASGDLQLEHLSSNSFIKNTAVGDLYIENQVDDKDIIFRSDDGSGGLATYFFLDGSETRVTFNKNARFIDSALLELGTSGDLQIFHNSTDSFIDNYTGNLTIRNRTDDGDIVFTCDDGSGGLTEYFKLDGSITSMVASKDIVFNDNVRAEFGDAGDLDIYHNGTDSVIENDTGDLYITNKADDKDIVFRSDDGSGGFNEYFRVDGTNEVNKFIKHAQFLDSIEAKFGNGGDLRIYHDGTNTYLQNTTGDLSIINYADDSDIKFFSDDGSGGVTEYFRLDGSVGGSDPVTRFPDSAQLQFGTDGDSGMRFDGSKFELTNSTGNFEIINYADDSDIIFKSDDGSGGVTPYMTLNGTNRWIRITAALGVYHNDGIASRFGTSGDLQIYHDATNSYVSNLTGNLIIEQNTNDGDIIFKSDDGSGGITEYFRVDGGSETIVVSKALNLIDSTGLKLGSSGNDFSAYHNGSNTFLDNNTGDLNIRNTADDKDIIFQCDDGSGGVETYFFLDGGDSSANPLTVFPDNARAGFGASGDLQIYHDGSNSFIQDTGTGNLYIDATSQIIFRDYGSAEEMAKFINDGAVELYHDNSKKLETTSTGATVTGTLIAATGDLETSGVGYGLVLKSPNGTRFRITVDNSGNLSTTSL
jgi:hypothetical protein